MAATPATISKLPVKEEELDEDFQEELSRGCCFRFPCFRSGHSDSSWERITSTPSKDGTTTSSSWDPLGKGLKALKKIREWSELVAGPKWKTFIRRFNRNRGSKNGVRFQYDPLSYSMNFDEGPGQNSVHVVFTDDGDVIYGVAHQHTGGMVQLYIWGGSSSCESYEAFLITSIHLPFSSVWN